MHSERKKCDDTEKDPLIIDRPEAMSAFRYRTELSITVIGWIIWFVFLRPLILVFLWYLGVKIFYTHMIYLKGYRTIVDQSLLYVGGVILLYCIVRGWNIYNLFRYGRRERRIKVQPATAGEIEKFFHLPASSGTVLQGWREVKISFQGAHTVIVSNARSCAPEFYTGSFVPRNSFRNS